MRDLLDAILEPGGLSVHFQPIMELHGDDPRVYGLECLIRGPKGTNLENAEVLFEYVRRKREESLVDRACVKAAFECARNIPVPTHLSVNVHASTLGRDHEFLVFLGDVADVNAISLTDITVEIVEHAPPWDGRSFLDALEGLRRIGVRIGLDDVGLGQSNYRMILDCRPDYFKVDRYFALGCAKDPYRQAVLESIHELARRFGGRVVAEGVEVKEDLAAIQAIGIDLVQGYYFSPAAPLARLIDAGLLPPPMEKAEPDKAEPRSAGSA
jgi:EAL domain-containing protein (putative c-di-GMP-specific phosphodiesterase class I)